MLNSEKIQNLDPLGFDPYVQTLTQINNDLDFDALQKLALEVFDKAVGCELVDEHISNAVLRDLGMVMGSLKKQGIEPCRFFEPLEPVLINAGKVADLLPRDSSFHYGLWNPTGPRERSFTGLLDEHHLINSVRYTIPPLRQAVELFDKALKTVDSNINESIGLIVEANKLSSAALAEAIRYMELISPSVFSKTLRPYFDPVEVQGVKYIGPGGGQIPLFILDYMLMRDFIPAQHHYPVFSTETVKVMPANLRNIFAEYSLLPSLVQRLSQGNLNPELKPVVRETMQIIIRFRQAHLNLARKSFTAQNIGKYNTGSAGYQVKFVEEILMLTKNALKVLEHETIAS